MPNENVPQFYYKLTPKTRTRYLVQSTNGNYYG